MDLQSEPCIIYRTHYLSSSTPSSSAARDRHFPTLAQAHATSGGGGRALTPRWPKPRIFFEEQHPLRDHLIPKSAWRVLHTLRNAGFECYLVGGSVRDLFLGRVPKDFDVLSTASLREVKHLFPKCYIVGRRFPIVHVHMMGQIIEVSSFEETSGEMRRGNVPMMDNRNRMNAYGRNGGRASGRHRWLSPDEMVGRCRWLNMSPEEMDMARQMNAFKRDFTINGLMYDPFNRILYDYVGGVRDLQRPTIRTIIPADVSFDEDPARILRAVRVAARLGFPLETSTGKAIERHAPSVLTIPKSRSMLELNIMIAHGAAEASFRLLWRYRLLELLLPFQASYLSSIHFKRNTRRSNLLLELLHMLDQKTSPDRPCDGSLWVALAAFHLAVSELQPRNIVLTAAAFACSERTGPEDAACRAKTLHERRERETREKTLRESELREEENRRASQTREKAVREIEQRENGRQRAEEAVESRLRENGCDQKEIGLRESKQRENGWTGDGSSQSEQRESERRENGNVENERRENGSRLSDQREIRWRELGSRGERGSRENERREGRENRRAEDSSRSPPERMKWVRKDVTRKPEAFADDASETSSVNGYGNGNGNGNGNAKHGISVNGNVGNGVANGVCHGSFQQIVRELKELGDASLAMLQKMTDPLLAVKEIMNLMSLRADPQVLFTKGHIFKAECILRCIGGTGCDSWSSFSDSLLRPTSPNLDIDRDISETTLLFSQIIFDTPFPNWMIR